MFIEINQGHLSEIIFTSLTMLVILGHNLWLVARNENDEIKIEVITSDKFPESDSPVKLERIKDFRGFTKDNSVEITNYQITEKELIAGIKAKDELNVIGLELHPHPIVLESQKFAGYIASEAAESLVAPKFVAGETMTGQRESYAKFAKVLIDNNSFDKVIGYKLEIVFESNPAFLKPNEKLKVKVLFDNKPAPNLRVSGGAEGLNGGKYTAHSWTDENGLAELEISSEAKNYFVRTHFIRPHANRENLTGKVFGLLSPTGHKNCRRKCFNTIFK